MTAQPGPPPHAPGPRPVAPPGAEPTVGGSARILDQGYRHYDGPRRGVSGAMRAVYKAAMQRALGLKRSARFKIIPVLSAALSYVPAIVFVGVLALLPDRFADELPFGYSDYYGYITAAIVLFVSFVTPEILCTDRRSGMLGLYLAGPLDRVRYLAAKAAAVATVLAVVTLGPTLLLLIGFTLADHAPNGAADAARTVLRIVVSAAVVTLWYTALSMAVSSLTDRRAFASAAVILTVLVPSSVVGALVGAGLSQRLQVFDLLGMPFELVQRIYGEPRGDSFRQLPTALLAAATLLWTAAAAAVVLWRYRRLAVTK